MSRRDLEPKGGTPGAHASRHRVLAIIMVAFCQNAVGGDVGQFAVLKDSLGPDFRLTRQELRSAELDAWECVRKGDFTGAAGILEEAEKTAKSTSGPRSRDVALILGALARVQIDLGEAAPAEECLKRALENAEAADGREHPVTASLLVVEARLKFARGELEQALSECGQSLAIYQKAYGSNNGFFRDVLVKKHWSERKGARLLAGIFEGKWCVGSDRMKQGF